MKTEKKKKSPSPFIEETSFLLWAQKRKVMKLRICYISGEDLVNFTNTLFYSLRITSYCLFRKFIKYPHEQKKQPRIHLTTSYVENRK